MTSSWLLFFKDMQKRILSIDYGERRVGLAITDPSGIVASPLTTLSVHSTDGVILAIVNLIKELSVTRVVIGLPKLLSGLEGDKAAKVRKMAEQISNATGIDCLFWDERFSSASAKRMLLESETKRSRRTKEKLDALAATVILNDYLKSQTS